MTAVCFAEIDQHSDILRLALEVAQLPTEDLAGPNKIFFGLSDDRGPIGYIGLEGNGSDRLLRSLVVLPARQGQGHGRTLIERLEAVAEDAVERLHLLTTGPGSIFRKLGYIEADRSTAPTAIAATAQFSSLCGPRATYLVKDIG